MNDAGRTILFIVLVLVLLPLLWGGMMMGGVGMMGGWGRVNDWSPWWGALRTLSAALMIGGIGVLVWWSFGRSASAPPPSDRPGARDILDARYARGEITREQYQQMRADLES